MKNDIAAGLGIAAFVVIIVAVAPIVLLWAINVLVVAAGGIVIPLTWSTWFAVLIIFGLLAK